MEEQFALQIKNLSVSLPSGGQLIHAVDGLSFNIPQGKTFALVGESGCGKSITAHTIMRLLPDSAQIFQGSEILLEDYPLLSDSEKAMRKIRGEKMGMIFQDPMAALNPVLSIQNQMMEALCGRIKRPSRQEQKKLIDLLESVRISEPLNTLQSYPHQLSGGMKQRVMIAMAIAHEPDLLIADEPTTALDVTTQAQVLKIIRELQIKKGMSILLITHDLGVVAQMADEVGVMYAGYLVEHAKAEDFFKAPKHPYSQKLLAAIPDQSDRTKPLAVIQGQVPQLTQRETLCRFRDRCHNATSVCHQVKPLSYDMVGYGDVRCLAYDQSLETQEKPVVELPPKEPLADPYTAQFEAPILKIEDLKVHFPIRKGLLKRIQGHVKAVDGVSFSLAPSQTLALVGESGCGKTTVGKAILKLLETTHGRVVYWGKDITQISDRLMRRVRGDLQIVFQDPFTSMDPKMRVAQILEEGMIALKIGTDKKERQDRIDNLLEQVGLSPQMKYRYPHEFSGGQRQRICIARALSVSPKIIVCDEPTSALDVSVQAQILNLLTQLKLDYEISFVFITHNIGVVKYVADVVSVMYLGRIIESGTADQVLNHPKHPYTQALLASVPEIEKGKQFTDPPQGEVPSPINPPKGCHFAPRCPHAMPQCLEAYPPAFSIEGDHFAKCYLYDVNIIEEDDLKKKSNG